MVLSPTKRHLRKWSSNKATFYLRGSNAKYTRQAPAGILASFCTWQFYIPVASLFAFISLWRPFLPPRRTSTMMPEMNCTYACAVTCRFCSFSSEANFQGSEVAKDTRDTQVLFVIFILPHHPLLPLVHLFQDDGFASLTRSSSCSFIYSC